MKNVILKGYILIPVDELSVVQAVLERHKILTMAEPGCLIFEVTQDAHQKNKYHVYEKFKDEVSFQAHQERVQISDWGKVTRNVERFYQLFR